MPRLARPAVVSMITPCVVPSVQCQSLDTMSHPVVPRLATSSGPQPPLRLRPAAGVERRVHSIVLLVPPWLLLRRRGRGPLNACYVSIATLPRGQTGLLLDAMPWRHRTPCDLGM